MENPFSLKVGQVFTGFGVGCGLGIGIGRPVYFGAIPGLQPVLSATRGATDALSVVGRHFTGFLIKLGMKRVEAGIGCGIGIGHGFGVGIAMKPWVFHRIQTSIAESVTKVMKDVGLAPSLPSLTNLIPRSTPIGTQNSNVHAFVGGSLDPSKTFLNTFQHSETDGTIHRKIVPNIYEENSTLSRTPLVSCTEKVMDNFFQSPGFKSEAEAELSEMVRNLRTENNVLQLLLKHQKIIDSLMDENQKLQKVLIEDLKIPLEKLNASCSSSSSSVAMDCFECRRRRRNLKK